MTYAVELTPAARRQLRKLDPPIQRRLVARMEALADDPRPDGVVKLTDVSPPLYRVCEGDYRIVYAIYDGRLVVLVVRVSHRSEVYR